MMSVVKAAVSPIVLQSIYLYIIQNNRKKCSLLQFFLKFSESL